MTPASRPGVEGFVLAGGRSTRMGRDKALIELAGKPLIAYAVETLRNAGLTARIAGARSHLSAFAPVIPDATPGGGPLSGICTALSAAQTGRVVFLSVDMPLLPAALLHYMAGKAVTTGSMVTLVSLNGFPETFPAVVSSVALPFFQQELETGRGSCRDAYQAAALAAKQQPHILPVESLAHPGGIQHPFGLPAERWFHNVNTPEALALAEQWLTGAIA